LKRAEHSKSFLKLWDFTGGKQEPGETPTQAVIRETREETSMKKDELKDFIKKELSQGKDREEITKNLERIGYNIENINQIFDEELHNALPKEYEQQIRKYVAYYLDKGNTPEEIREKLKAQGWSDNVIDKFLVR